MEDVVKVANTAGGSQLLQIVSTGIVMLLQVVQQWHAIVSELLQVAAAAASIVDATERDGRAET